MCGLILLDLNFEYTILYKTVCYYMLLYDIAHYYRLTVYITWLKSKP